MAVDALVLIYLRFNRESYAQSLCDIMIILENTFARFAVYGWANLIMVTANVCFSSQSFVVIILESAAFRKLQKTRINRHNMKSTKSTKITNKSKTNIIVKIVKIARIAKIAKV